MTGVLVALISGTVIGFAAGWWTCNDRHKTRQLNAHLAELKADVFRESSERLYDELEAVTAAVTPELTRLRDKALRWRDLALRGKATT